jgi:hypothetical protein
MLDIITAVENKLRIEFIYKKKQRSVQPLLLGISKSGDLFLRGNQVSPTNSGLKLFKVAEMTALKVTDTVFLTVHPLFKTKDSQIIKTIAVITH